ncbi:MAG: SRPBCC family protein [Solirubrobacterales bacterium]
MFEATHSERSTAEAAAIWELWADPARWPDWNEQLERVESDGELRVGAELRLKLRRGGTVRFTVTELEPERLFADEARFPGARLGHEHRLAPGRSSVEITHRVYLAGALSGFWALMMGRKRLRESVVRFVERERELTEPKAQRGGKRRG